MTRRWLALLAITSVFIFVVAGCAPEAAPPAEQPPVEKPPVEKVAWRYGCYPSPKSIQSATVMWFFDEVSRRSEGQFTCKYYFSHTLVPTTQEVPALTSGLIEATCFGTYARAYTPLFVDISYLPGLIPQGEYNADYIRSSIKMMDDLMAYPAAREQIAHWDALPIAETYPAFKVLMTKGLIQKVSALKGVKVYGAGVIAGLLSKLGAAPATIPIPETYDALQKGVIDAMCHGWPMIIPYHFYEVLNYYVAGTNFGHMSFPLMVKASAYEDLPDNLKGIFEEVTEDWKEWQVDHYMSEYEKAMAMFKESGGEIIYFAPTEWAKVMETAQTSAWPEALARLEKEGMPAAACLSYLEDSVKKHFGQE